jgi:CheY-like chemotaxis protein
MDGLQLTKRIRVMDKNIPIILLSSISDDSSKSHPEIFSAVLTKPVRQGTLCKHILIQLKQQDKFFVDDRINKKKLSTEVAKQYPLRILIAEDNPINYKLAERILSKLGYVADKALNGLEAVESVKQKQYDIILMDVQMPEMDGIEATRTIRLLKQMQPIIIAMTANAMQEDKEACLAAGMNDYISKPIKLDNLISILERWAVHLQKEKANILNN